MRIMIVGQQWLGAEVLRLCLARGDEVTAVSVPRLDDRLAALATAEGIPVCQVQGRFSAGWIPAGTDLLLCVHAHVFITGEARAATRYGALGYHPSLLPRHRGRDAVRWAVHMRDILTGGTVYWMDDGADTGPIAAQDWCWIRPEDTPGSLWRRELAPMGLRLISETLDNLDAGAVIARPQNEVMATWEPAFRGEPLCNLK